MNKLKVRYILAAVVLFVSILVGFSSCDYNTPQPSPLLKKYTNTVWLGTPKTETSRYALVFTDDGVCTIVLIDKDYRILATRRRALYQIKDNKLHINGLGAEDYENGKILISDSSLITTGYYSYSVIKPKDLKQGDWL